MAKIACLPVISICAAIIVFTCWQAIEFMVIETIKVSKMDGIINRLKKEIEANVLAATLAFTVGTFTLIGGFVYIIH